DSGAVRGEIAVGGLSAVGAVHRLRALVWALGWADDVLSWPDGQLHPAVSDRPAVWRGGGRASHPEISPAGQALSGRQLQPGDAVLPAADCHGVAGGLLQLIFRGLLGELSPLPAGLDAGAFAADDCARAAGGHGGAEPHRQLMGGADAAECWAGGDFDWGLDRSAE